MPLLIRTRTAPTPWWWWYAGSVRSSTGTGPNEGGHDRVTINRTVYEGVLHVTDAEVLRRVLVTGIGRSKATAADS